VEGARCRRMHQIWTRRIKLPTVSLKGCTQPNARASASTTAVDSRRTWYGWLGDQKSVHPTLKVASLGRMPTIPPLTGGRKETSPCSEPW
jgi:hypothetical protein